MEKISVPGLTFMFYDNYIEITNRLGFLGFLFPKKVVIAYRNIASVDANVGTGKLVIETSGGKTYKYKTGFSANKIKDKILNNLGK